MIHNFKEQPIFVQLLLLFGIGLVFMGVASILSIWLGQYWWGASWQSAGLVDVRLLRLAQFTNAIGLFVLPPILLAKWSSEHPRGWLGVSRWPSAPHMILTALLVLSAMPAINAMATWNMSWHLPASWQHIEASLRAAEENAELLVERLLVFDGPMDMVLAMLLVAVLPAVGEELFFRGVLQKLMCRWTKNVHVGIWITGLVFSLMHGQFFGLVPRMILGAMLGYLYLWSGSLWLPILAHFVNNATAVLLYYLVAQSMISPSIEEIGAQDDTLYLAGLSLVVVGFLLQRIQRSKSSGATI